MTALRCAASVIPAMLGRSAEIRAFAVAASIVPQSSAGLSSSISSAGTTWASSSSAEVLSSAPGSSADSSAGAVSGASSASPLISAPMVSSASSSGSFSSSSAGFSSSGACGLSAAITASAMALASASASIAGAQGASSFASSSGTGSPSGSCSGAVSSSKTGATLSAMRRTSSSVLPLAARPKKCSSEFVLLIKLFLSGGLSALLFVFESMIAARAPALPELTRATWLPLMFLWVMVPSGFSSHSHLYPQEISRLPSRISWIVPASWTWMSATR